MQWIKIADAEHPLNFNAEGLCEMELEGHKICMAKFKDQTYACAARCPHAGGQLSAGYMNSLGHIVCPVHGYKFNLETGYQTDANQYLLKLFPLKQEGPNIFVGLPK